MHTPSRRDFLKTSGLLSLGFLGLQRYVSAADLGAPRTVSPFGELLRDPHGILNLPEGFSHQIISLTGRRMDDGVLTPGKHDGMAAFSGPDGETIVICNHELAADWRHLGPWGTDNRALGRTPTEAIYDRGEEGRPCLGGTTTIVYDTRKRERVRQFLSLAGTEKNCAGGPTPWGSWITCEETNQRAVEGFAQDHGYNFEVPATSQIGLAKPIPLKAMGRFRHEAIAVEPVSGVVYQTEDMGDGLIYRFIPKEPGNLAAGGRLQALALLEVPSADTRDWGLSKFRMPIGQRFKTHWLDLDNVEAPEDDLRHRGRAAGAATFARGEGMFYGDNQLFWCCTNGGSKLLGQVFRYTPSPFEGTARESEQPGEVELFVESHDANVLNNCDNCVLAPWGDLIVAEDTDAPCRLIGITPKGELYPLARNILNDSELAGPCFSPDGTTLFVNLQNPGITLAITGPWEAAAKGV